VVRSDQSGGNEDSSENGAKEALYNLYCAEPRVPTVRGVDLLKDSTLNKGMAFTLHERQALGLHGLLPPAFMTEAQQAYRILSKLRKQPDDLARYIQLDSLQVLLFS
jgi:hypothetical protein